MSTVKQWGRDPYARTDHFRQSIEKAYRKPCANCGNREGRYQYKVEGDCSLFPSRGSSWSRGFCSVSCWRDYI